MEEEQLTPIIEELTQVLEGKASREDIEKQVKTFANVYNIEDPQRIRDSILRKLICNYLSVICFTSLSS